MEQNKHVPLFRLKLEYYLKNIDEMTGGKSRFKSYINWELFIDEIKFVIFTGKPVILYLSTEGLRYSFVYQKYRPGKHCIILKEIKQDKCLIEDYHIRVGSKLEGFRGWIDMEEIKGKIISYAYQEKYGIGISSPKEIIKDFLGDFKHDISCMEIYLDRIICCLKNPIDLKNDCLENYIHMNIFSGLHYWSYLYDYIYSLNLDIRGENLLNLINNQIDSWNLCKTFILKYMYLQNIELLLKNVNVIKRNNSNIIYMMNEIHIQDLLT